MTTYIDSLRDHRAAIPASGLASTARVVADLVLTGAVVGARALL